MPTASPDASVRRTRVAPALLVRAIAERRNARATASAQRNGVAAAGKRDTIAVEQLGRAAYQQRTVRAHGDGDLRPQQRGTVTIGSSIHV